MSVEASEALSEVWTRWQGHVINSEFRLGRCLGSSDHSGVYLTRSAALDGADLAIKLVPTNRALAEQLLPRWKRASVLTHPHLLRLLAWGGCQLEGLPYLYLVMEYADQTLAQLLARRALAAEEARQLLAPSLDALGFLHGQGCVQGQLKPANVLVVGEQLKLASDTIRRVGEGAVSTHALTAYDPPEGRQGNTSPAGDVWALGVTLFEALTRRLPPATGEPRDALAPPPELAQDLRELVLRCLSADPLHRPGVTELLGTAAAPAVEVAAAAAAAAGAEAPIEDAVSAAPPEVVAIAAPVVPAGVAVAARPRIGFAAVLAGVAVAAVLVYALVRTSGHPPAPPVVVSPPAGAAAPASATEPSAGGVGAQPLRQSPAETAAIHEVMPDVPASARRTIHGHIKVWVRVVVDADGTVFAAVADRTGPSHYFQRLAVEAAKKWSFPPAEKPARRIMQVQFDFSRDGTTARARPVS